MDANEEPVAVSLELVATSAEMSLRGRAALQMVQAHRDMLDLEPDGRHIQRMVETRCLPSLHLSLLYVPEQGSPEKNLLASLYPCIQAPEKNPFNAAPVCRITAQATIVDICVMYCIVSGVSYGWSLRAGMGHASIISKSIGGARSTIRIRW
jgi:hypothetical protein